jgi:hypothetical protein
MKCYASPRSHFVSTKQSFGSDITHLALSFRTKELFKIFKRESNHLSMMSTRRFDTRKRHRCNQNLGPPMVEHCLLSCRNPRGMNFKHILRCQPVYQRPRLKKSSSQPLLHQSGTIILSVNCMLSSLAGVPAC